MLFVATFSGGQCQQDVAFFAGAPSCEIAVHRGLGLFVDQILAPSAQIRRTGVRMRSRDCLSARLATRHFIAIHGRIMTDGPHRGSGPDEIRGPCTSCITAGMRDESPTLSVALDEARSTRHRAECPV